MAVADRDGIGMRCKGREARGLRIEQWTTWTEPTMVQQRATG